MSPEADELLATLDFAPTCITVNHNGATVRPDAHWVVYPHSCCGDRVWLFCDDCLFVLFRPEGWARFENSDHTHIPARTLARTIKAIG